MGRISWLWRWAKGEESLQTGTFYAVLLAPLIAAATHATLVGGDLLEAQLYVAQKRAQDAVGAPFPVPVDVTATESRGGFLMTFPTPNWGLGGRSQK